MMGMQSDKEDKETIVLLVKSYPVKNMLSAYLEQNGNKAVETINAADAIHYIAKNGIPDAFIVCDSIGEKKEAVRLLMNIQRLTKDTHIPSVVILTDKKDYFEKISLPEYIKGVGSEPSIIKLKDSVMEAHNEAKELCQETISGPMNGQVQKALSQSELVTHMDKALKMFESVVNKVAENKLPGPVMPGLLQEVREVIDQPDISFKVLANFIRKHQSLALKILATVNSAFYSRGSKVETVEQAISTLGLKTTNSLMQSVAALQYVVGSDEEIQDMIKTSLKKAYLVALVAQMISEHEGYSQADKAFSIGLFHNLGATFLYYTYALLIDKGELEKIDANSLNTIATKCTARLNRILSKKIKLPDEISLMHSSAEIPAESEKLIKIIHKALYLSDAMLESDEALRITQESKMLEIDERLLNKFNSKIADLRGLVNDYV